MMRLLIVSLAVLALAGCQAKPPATPAPAAAAPKIHQWFIDGAVAHPGVYDFNAAGRPMTVTEAIQAAGGLTAQADRAHIVVKRLTGDVTQDTIPVDLDKIARKEAADLVLKDTDLIQVPAKTAPASK